MFPMGWTLSTMAWAILNGKDLLQSQNFDGTSNLKWAVSALEYGLKFLLDCSYDDGEFVAQVRQYFGLKYLPVRRGLFTRWS